MRKPLISMQNYHLHSLVKFTSSGNETLCHLVCINRRFYVSYCLHLQGKSGLLDPYEGAKISEADTHRPPVWRRAEFPQKLQGKNFHEVQAKECNTITFCSQNHTIMPHLNFCSQFDVKKEIGTETVWELMRHKFFDSQEPDLLQCGIQNKHTDGRLPQASSSDSCRAARIGLQLHRYLIPVGSQATLGLLLMEPLHFRHHTESVSASLYEGVKVKASHLSIKLFCSLPHPNKLWIPPNLKSRGKQVVYLRTLTIATIIEYWW